MTNLFVVGIAALVLAQAVPARAQSSPEAETEGTDVRERLRLYHERDFRDRIRKDNQEREARERIWMRYGDLEVKRVGWRRLASGVWQVEVRDAHRADMDVRLGTAMASRMGPLQLAVDCRGLTVNEFVQFFSEGQWKGWKRPDPDSDLEQLLVDRCSKP